MSKKITGILLCMLMVITLAACGNSSEKRFNKQLSVC